MIIIPILYQLVVQVKLIDSVDTRLINKAINVADAIFLKNEVTAVIWNKNNNEYAAKFLYKFEGVVATNSVTRDGNVTRSLKRQTNYQQVIFFSSEAEEFKKYLTMLKADLLKPLKIFFVATGATEVTEITKIAWQFEVADLIILNKMDSYVTLSTYYPYRNGNCSDTSPIFLHNEAEVKAALDKKFINFNGCPIKVSVLGDVATFLVKHNNGTFISVEGVDGSVFQMMLSKLNASWGLTYEIVTDVYKNGTPSSIFSDLTSHKSDILVPPVHMSPETYRTAQLTPLYKFIDIHWIAPKIEKMDPFGKILKPMYNEISPLLLASLIIFVIVTKIIKISKKCLDSPNGILFESFKILLGQDSQFEAKSSLVNSLFILWIWFCLVIRSVYQSDLTSGLQEDVQILHFTNFEEACKILPEFGGLYLFKNRFTGTSLENNYKIVPLNEIVPRIKNISRGTKFLIAEDLNNVRRANAIVEVVKKPFLSFPVCLYVRPGWPAISGIRKAIFQLVESGFVAKVYKENREWVKNANGTKSSADIVKPITLKSILPFFYGLEVLTLICISIFFIEIIWHKFHVEQTVGGTANLDH